jgi:hypothetical protein
MHMTEVIGPWLNDNSSTDGILFVYRPSFGRAGGSGAAQFGEFDAIIGTPKAVYLVESKWRLPMVNRPITLAQRQIFRHRVFRWLREHWFAQHPTTWEEFLEVNAGEFAVQFPGTHLAPPPTLLAGNLEYLLRQLNDYGERIQDVLLYFHLENEVWPHEVMVADGGAPFVVVPFVYHPLNNGGIIDMQA